jgi:hypothetical protein
MAYRFDSKIKRPFAYTSATATNIRLTFARLKREARQQSLAREAAQIEAREKVATIKRGKG